MERHFKEKGVFLSSENLDSTLLLNCLHALLSHYPTLRFTSITTDDKLGGFRVLFSGPEVTAVLEKKQLRIDDEVIGIYPLTTVLSIYDIGAFENPLLEDDVLEAVSEKYGKVFEVIKFDSEAVLDALSKKLENSFDTSKIESLEKKWRVRIDLPEFEGLEIFQSETEKFISLPKWDKNLKITFWCRCCKMSGHFQHSCPKKLQPVVAVRSENVLNGQSNYIEENKILKSPNIHVQSVSSLGSEVPSDSCDDHLSPETTENFVDTTERVPKARKTFRSSEDDNQNYKKIKTSESASKVKNDQNKNFLSLKNIKKEIVEEEDDDNSNRKVAQNMECDQSDNTDNENQSDTETDVRRFMSYEEETKLCIDTASNDASDFAGKAASEGKSDENSNSTFADEKEKITPSRTSTPSGPSHVITPTSSSILGAADTSILSDELQGYINHACETIGALDRQTLDAFLGYVKKKNKPTQIALKYTPNVKQLKDQLQMILTLRYHTKPTNQVKEDAVFIKWLEGLVSRFDNTKPSKRKKPGLD